MVGSGGGGGGSVVVVVVVQHMTCRASMERLPRAFVEEAWEVLCGFSRTVGANAMGFPHLFARNGMADMTVERSTSIGGHKPWMGQCNVTFWLKD